MKTIGIIGCGWLAQKWISTSSNHFKITTRTGIKQFPSKNIIEIISFDATIDQLNVSNWSDCDYIVCSIPFSKRNSLEVNEKMALHTVSGLSKVKKPVILLSSIGVYKELTGIIDENSHSLTPSIEIAEKIFERSLQSTTLRLGGLMGDDRFLSKYLSIGDRQLVNHVHFKDVIKAIEWVAHNNLWTKIYNVVAPEHPSRNQLITFEKTGLFDLVRDNFSDERIIDSSKIIAEGFKFDLPNPLYFK